MISDQHIRSYQQTAGPAPTKGILAVLRQYSGVREIYSPTDREQCGPGQGSQDRQRPDIFRLQTVDRTATVLWRVALKADALWLEAAPPGSRGTKPYNRFPGLVLAPELSARLAALPLASVRDVTRACAAAASASAFYNAAAAAAAVAAAADSGAADQGSGGGDRGNSSDGIDARSWSEIVCPAAARRANVSGSSGGPKEAGQRANESDSGGGSCGSMEAGQLRRNIGSCGGSSLPMDSDALVRALARTIITVRHCDVL